MQWLDSISSWLVYSTVCGGFLLLLGWLAAGLCREPIYRVKIIQWTLAACLVVPVFQQLNLLPGVSLAILRPPLGAATAAAPPATPLEGAARGEAFPEAFEPRAAASDARRQAPIASTGVARAVAPRPAASDLATPADAVATRSGGPATFSRFAWLKLAGLAAYGAIAIGLLVRLLIGFAGRGAIARRSQPAHAAIQAVLRLVAGGETRETRLLVSEEVDSPMMWGLLRTTIVLPAAMVAKGDRQQLRWSLAHEWSHVLRRDFAVSLLATAAQLVCFYQPAVWWLRRQLLLSQDYLADAFAAGQGESNEDYAAFLVSLARKRNVGTLAMALGIGDRKSNLRRRVRLLVHSARPVQQQDRRLPAVAIALAAILVVGGVSAVRLDAKPADDPAATPAQRAGNDAKPNANPTPPSQEQGAPKDPQKKEPQAKEPPDPISYTGVVVDRDTGKPIAGATVAVTRELSRDPKTNTWKRLHTTSHTTDEKGLYRFTLPSEEVAEPSLFLVVDANHPNYQPKGRSGYSHTMIRKNLASGEPPFFSKIELSGGAPVVGTILNPDGSPAAGAIVRAYTKAPSPVLGIDFSRGAFQTTVADAEGKFRIIAATPGDGVFWVFAKGASPLARRIGETRGDLGAVRLAKGATLTGRVLDAKGQPVAGVGVELRRDGDGDEADEFLAQNGVANGIRGAGETDAEGRFETNPLPAGKYRVEVSNVFADPFASDRDRDRVERAPLPHVFSPLEIEIAEGRPTDAIEIRSTPHVIVRGRFVNSKGEPRASHRQHLFGSLDGKPFFTQSTKPLNDGWFEFRVPHGLERTVLNLMTNEHSALRFRLKPGDKLSHGRRADIGVLEEDLTTVEIIRYEAPLLLVKAVDEAGGQIRDFKIRSRYKTRPQDENDGAFVSGALGDIGFEEQPDGRWRSSQMLPDEETTITLEKVGFEAAPQVVTMKEGEERELVIVFKKSK